MLQEGVGLQLCMVPAQQSLQEGVGLELRTVPAQLWLQEGVGRFRVVYGTCTGLQLCMCIVVATDMRCVKSHINAVEKGT